MAINLGPSGWFDNWSSDGTNITLPIASLPGLDVLDAGAASGDIREVALAWSERLHTVYFDLPTADRPTKMTVAKSVSAISNGTQIRSQFTFTFVTEITEQSVPSE